MTDLADFKPMELSDFGSLVVVTVFNPEEHLEALETIRNKIISEEKFLKEKADSILLITMSGLISPSTISKIKYFDTLRNLKKYAMCSGLNIIVTYSDFDLRLFQVVTDSLESGTIDELYHWR